MKKLSFMSVFLLVICGFLFPQTVEQVYAVGVSRRNMNKILIFFMMLFTTYGLFAQTPAGHLRGYSETDDYCGVEDYGRLHFWLYDTYTYYDGDGELLIEAFISYAERLGWTVNYDNFKRISPNNGLELSIRKMMTARNSDVSMTIIEYEPDFALMYLHSYTRRGGYWFTYIYPLIK